MVVETIDPFKKVLEKLLKEQGFTTNDHPNGGFVTLINCGGHDVPLAIQLRAMRGLTNEATRGVILEAGIFAVFGGQDNLWNLGLAQILNDRIFLKFSVVPNKEKGQNIITVSNFFIAVTPLDVNYRFLLTLDQLQSTIITHLFPLIPLTEARASLKEIRCNLDTILESRSYT